MPPEEAESQHPFRIIEFPTIDDEVHIVTEDDLTIIFRRLGPSQVEIGTHASSESLAATIDLDKLVTRHAAIVGSTGSGKSNTVAGLLKAMLAHANKILARLKDRRFKFVLEPGSYNGKKSGKDLNDLLAEWLTHQYTITVLDLAGVPFEVIDLIVGVITRIIFETMFWGRDLKGLGRQRPLLLIYEEAHAYVPRTSGAQFIAGYASRAVRRVLKEGRKYGVGAILVSQRPSELDETILSQCGTFFALRLSNSDDQSRIKSTVPDTLAGLVDLLPALGTGEALVVGEAVQIPTRIRLPLIEPRPKSDDPATATCWKGGREPAPQYDAAVTAWRRQRNEVSAKKAGGKKGKTNG
jgi:uncharacterized protein